MAPVVSSESLQQAGPPRESVRLSWRVRALSSANWLASRRWCPFAYCCRKRKPTAASTDQQAAVAVDFFTTGSVAKDNAVEAAMNGAAAADRAVQQAMDAIEAAKIRRQQVQTTAEDDYEVVHAELNRSKST